MAESEVQEPQNKGEAKAVAPKPDPESKEKNERLENLRAQLDVAEHVVSDVPEDAPDEVKAAASKVKADAEKALGDAHVDEQKKAEQRDREVRNAEAQRDLSLQESNQSASTQNVRGTEHLTPEEHANRRNPR